MKKELDEALVRDFPLLYRDRQASMRNTCMCWGFECGDGWEPLIRDLSVKLEAVIKKWIEDNNPNTCAMCGCPKTMHDVEFINGVWQDTKCLETHYLQYYFSFKYKSIGWPSPMYRKTNLKEKWEIFKNKLIFRTIERLKIKFIVHPVNLILKFLHENFDITNKIPCHCTKYILKYPCASQVKEKYGTGRFYMTYYTNEIDKLIKDWENKTAQTCEDCGAPGALRNNHNWYTTLCDKCATDKNGNIIPTDKEVLDNEI